MADNTVVIFNLLTNQPERHTRANARDFVNIGTHTWHAGRPSTPASFASYAIFKAPEGSNTQEVLNKATGSSADGKTGAAATSETLLNQQLAAQQALLLAEQAAADQAAAAAATAAVPVQEVADFTAPVDAGDEVDDAALEAEADAEAEATATPTTRRRRNS